ncbi:hypothetical protein BU112_14690 [Staphylococcus shinii]|uniref:Uncharacterized protein n=2 Tax=Staphylococcus TaxID=1279 RepID=A0A418IBN2_9STAP|nr:hypothetical protein BU112_14690 [Staphylococcus shinii]
MKGDKGMGIVSIFVINQVHYISD